jgi:hypothetical protein
MLYANLLKHAKEHGSPEVFDQQCAECVYWASKVLQSAANWKEYYTKQQKSNLMNIPLETINEAIRLVAPDDNTGTKAKIWTELEFRNAMCS